MTDREFLELAAKAAGIDAMYTKRSDAVWGCIIHNANGTDHVWNPITDDGDALRLAVNRRFTIKDFAPHDSPEIVQAAALWGTVEIWQQDDNDPLYVEWYKAGADRYAATRRAIVRAAAEIGRTMA